MLLPQPADIAALATKQLSVFDQTTGAVGAFILSDIQLKLLESFCSPEETKCIVLKARQIRATTTALLFATVYAILNPGAKIAIVLDKATNASAHLVTISHWLNQLGIGIIEQNQRHLKLITGSQIYALSAATKAGAESRTGRGNSFSLIICSELSYWQNAEATFASLVSTLTSNGRLIVESTATSAANKFYQLWHQDNEWNKVFISTQDHSIYKDDPSAISDARFAELQKDLNITDRATASFYHSKLLNDFSGDLKRMLNEFPIEPQHAFTSADGRLISIDPKVLAPISTDSTGFEIFANYNPLFQYAMGIDTAAGNGGDASAFVIACLNTRSLVATYRSNQTPIVDYVNIINKAYKAFNCQIIRHETNGVGEALSGLFAQAKIRPTILKGIHSTLTTKTLGLQQLKAAIAEGIIFAGQDYADECKSATVKLGPNGSLKYTGKDDLLMATSFIIEDIAKGIPEPIRPPDPRQVFIPVYKRKERVRY